MLATTTHDTKRAEDARLRVGMLSEMPERWRDAVAAPRRVWPRATVARTRRHARPNTSSIRRSSAAHPLDADRAWAYMLKAAREAKLETNWIEPNQQYEAELEHFVRGMLADPDVAGGDRRR